MFGLSDASPFVTKADVLLKISGLPYTTQTANFSKAPKGKIPYFDDDGHRFGDTTFLRFYLEDKYGIDFDKGLSAAERGAAWAFEKLAEDQLYWALVHARWTDKANFDKGPRRFFDAIPSPIRPLIVPMIKRSVIKALHGQGFGRHCAAEIKRLDARARCHLSADRRQTLADGGNALWRRCVCMGDRYRASLPSLRDADTQCGRFTREPDRVPRSRPCDMVSGSLRSVIGRQKETAGQSRPHRSHALKDLAQPAVHFASHGTSSRLSTVPRIGDITSR